MFQKPDVATFHVHPLSSQMLQNLFGCFAMPNALARGLLKSNAEMLRIVEFSFRCCEVLTASSYRWEDWRLLRWWKASKAWSFPRESVEVHAWQICQIQKWDEMDTGPQRFLDIWKHRMGWEAKALDPHFWRSSPFLPSMRWCPSRRNDTSSSRVASNVNCNPRTWISPLPNGEPWSWYTAVYLSYSYVTCRKNGNFCDSYCKSHFVVPGLFGEENWGPQRHSGLSVLGPEALMWGCLDKFWSCNMNFSHQSNLRR